jgi:hypothetical protein
MLPTKQEWGQTLLLHKKSFKQRIWKVPMSGVAWKWLLISVLLSGVILVWYLVASQGKEQAPSLQPFRSFGIIAFVLVLISASYSLRRRFMRGLPGKTQDWLWMHTWLGITALLVAFFHESFAHVFYDYCSNLSCLTQSDGGTSALYALLLLVASGIIGRIVDLMQTRVIAHEASSNGVGIVRAVEERLLELEYTIERFCAGKSEEFQSYARQALAQDGQVPANPGTNPATVQGRALLPHEQHDFQQMMTTLATYAQLARSLRRQVQASQIIRIWRIIHGVIACIAFFVVLFHATLELLSIS